MNRHKSTVYVRDLHTRFIANMRAGKSEPISKQFRFVIHLAHACYLAGVEYDLNWTVLNGRMAATITAQGRIPEAKALPKEPCLKLVATWKPSLMEAAYSLEAYMDSRSGKRMPGFMIAHSSGLSLVRKGESESGELMSGDGEDIRQGWLITHTASGLGFGLSLSFQKATQALLLAASQPVDWTLSTDELAKLPAFRRAGLTVKAQFGKSWDRQDAERRLQAMEVAA